MGLGSNGEEEMSTVQQTLCSSDVTICKFAIPLEQLQRVLRPWFYFHPWIVFNENQWWSGAKQMRDQSGSLQALCLRGCPSVLSFPGSSPLPLHSHMEKIAGEAPFLTL